MADRINCKPVATAFFGRALIPHDTKPLVWSSLVFSLVLFSAGHAGLVWLSLTQSDCVHNLAVVGLIYIALFGLENGSRVL